MNTTTTMDNNMDSDKPKLPLSSIREQKGLSVEYVASKLHLRVRIIELIENGEFSLLPEPVFIKGYLRAYSKLLGVSPEPYIAVFNNQYAFEHKPERALWQSKRESNKAEHAIRWFTILFALGVMLAVAFWWQKNRDNQQVFSKKSAEADVSLEQTTTEVKLTDLSKMQSLLTPKSDLYSMEQSGG